MADSKNWDDKDKRPAAPPAPPHNPAPAHKSGGSVEIMDPDKAGEKKTIDKADFDPKKHRLWEDRDKDLITQGSGPRPEQPGDEPPPPPPNADDEKTSDNPGRWNR